MISLQAGMKIKSNKTNRTYVINTIDERINRLYVDCIEDTKYSDSWIITTTIECLNDGRFIIIKEEENTVDFKRKRKFLSKLDQILQENVDCYVNDFGEPTTCPNTEETIYNWIMENEEYHLLTSNYVKDKIHLFMTNFEERTKILYNNKLL